MQGSNVAVRRNFLALPVCLFLFGGLVLAQENAATLQGTVFDDTQAVLPGVVVTVRNQATGRTMETTTGAYGNYSIRNLDPGRYALSFEFGGFSRTEFPSVDVPAGQRLRLNATLKPGPVTTTVQVTDTPILVDRQNSSDIFQISREQLERLPRTRSFQEMSILAPRVNTGDIEGGVQINGASGAENVFLIDGVATNSAIDGRSRQNAVFEYLQEIQVHTAGDEAVYSGALGGTVSTVTRSGGNDYHGEGWLYYTNDFLSAAAPSRLALDPIDNRTVAYYQDDKNSFRGIEPGFSLGGPIRKDHIYFFTSWSPRWTRRDQTYRFSNGTEPGTIRREERFMSGFNKLTFEPNSRVRTNFSWLWTPFRSTGSLPVYNGSCPNCLSSTAASNAINADLGYFNPQSSYVGSAEFLVRSNLTVSARGSYFWDNYKDSGVPDITSVQYQSPAVPPLVPPELQGGLGFQNTPAILNRNHDRIARAQGQIDANLFGNFLGSHNLKGGFAVEKTVNNLQGAYPGGYVYVWWDRSFTSLVTGITDRGTYGYYEVNDFHTEGSAGGRTKALYVQDNWHPLERLTLNVGIRVEAEEIPSFRRDIRRSAIEFGWGQKLSPRIGGAFDVMGDGRLRVFASWSRLYDPTRYDLPRTVFGAETWRTYYRSLDTLDVFSLSLNNMPGRDLWNPGVTAFRDRRSAAAGLQSVARDLKPTSQDQWAGGADYQWNSQTAIGVRYVHQKLRRAIEDLAVLEQGNAAYIYANPGEGVATSAPFVTGRTAQPLVYPKPKRDYDAVELTFSRRFANHWFGSVSYTWSRLYGNYAGPASSDEVLTPATGLSYATAQQLGGSIAHPARYANLGWDLDEILFDAGGHLDPQGRLATDRPHVFKWNGGYDFELPGAAGTTSLGAFFYFGSGTPLSTVVFTTNHLPVFVNGRGDMGRTDRLSRTDLQVAHTLHVGERQDLRVELTVLNAFNQKTSRHRFNALNRGTGVFVESSAINLSNVDLRNGYDYNALIQATADGNDAFDPRYGMDDLFDDGASARLALKWSF